MSGAPSNRAALWDLATGETLAVLRDDGREAFQAAASADGRRAVETFMGQPTLVWDLDAAELLREIPPPSTLHAWPALSPDGPLLAVDNMEQFQVGRDQAISLSNLDDGREVLRIPHEGNARHLAFSPDARVLAVGDMQNAVVRLYDTSTGQMRRMIGDPTDSRGVNSVAFHPSGHELAMFVFAPRELRIVDLASEDGLLSVPMGTASIGARLCYSHNGDMLAVTTGDGLCPSRSAAPGGCAWRTSHQATSRQRWSSCRRMPTASLSLEVAASSGTDATSSPPHISHGRAGSSTWNPRRPWRSSVVLVVDPGQR